MSQRLPISEIFTSIQGEGLYSGTAMTFVRFAGCSVGRPIPPAERDPKEPAYRELCHAWDGRSFLCDTDFRRKEVLTVAELIDKIPQNVRRVCFTGGEPLNHDLLDIAWALRHGDHIVHVETSGTVELPVWANNDWVWLTVSPKKDVLALSLSRAHEIKLLVDSEFNLKKADELVSQCSQNALIWVQPINSEWELDRRHIDSCIEIIKQRPGWRLSSQLHKIWKVR